MVPRGVASREFHVAWHIAIVEGIVACCGTYLYDMSTWNKHYHWKTKGCTPWAKDWFKQNLVGKSVKTGDEASVKIDNLTGFEGDVELGNRKGKLITIYDCVVTLTWSGEAGDGTAANGTIKFPEVSHEIEDNNESYQFETELLSESSNKAHDLYKVVRTSLVPSLEEVFHRFRTELIESHAKDLGHEGDAPPTPDAIETPKAASSATVGISTKSSKEPDAVSTSTTEVRVASHLAISQADLWDLLTNPHRIPMWSKAPAQFSPNKGANFSLFGGNITGSIVEVSAPRKLVQTWRVPQWPAGYHGELTTELTQGDDSTKLELILRGIPTGQEDQARAGLENYYIRGSKSMGLGTIL